MCVLSHSVVSDSVTPWTVAHRLLCLWGFSRQEYWSGLPCPPPVDPSNPGIKPRSPALQADSLQSEPPGKPKNTGVGRLLLQGIFPTQELTLDILPCRKILYHLNDQRSPMKFYSAIKNNKIMPLEASWVELETIILSEVSQTEKDKYHMISLICGI